MPLLERARIEVYLPTGNDAAYRLLRAAFEIEFIETFGGCTVVSGLKGSYVNADGDVDVDDIDLLYVDTPFDLAENETQLTEYAAALQRIVLETTPEEAVLVVIHRTQHASS